MLKRDIFICLVLLVLSLSLYLFRLEEIPLGMAVDEAHEAHFALMVARGEYSVFGHAEGWGGAISMAPLRVFLMRFWPISPLAVRLPHAILSSLSVVIFYLLIRLLWSSRLVSFLSSILFLSSQWHVSFARLGVSVITVVIILLACSFFLLLAFKQKKWWQFTLARIFAGLIPAAYISGFLFYLVILIWWVLYLIQKENRKWKNLIIYITFFLLCASPFLREIYLFPERAISRASHTSILVAAEPERNVFLTYKKHVYETLQMFGFRSHQCGLPCPLPTTLDRATAAMFYLGILFALLTIFKMESLWILSWYLIMMNSSALSEVPGLATRAISLLPLVYITVASFLKLVVQTGDRLLMSGRYLMYGVITAIILCVSGINIFNYFNQQLNNREMAYQPSLGATFYEYYLAKFAAENQGSNTIYAWPTPDSLSFDAYILRDKKGYRSLNYDVDLNKLRSPLIFYFPAKEKQLHDNILKAFPSGMISEVSDYWGYPVAYIYDVRR